MSSSLSTLSRTLWPTRTSYPRPQHRTRLAAVATASSGFRARWSLDVKFGSKMDAVALLQEWIVEVGSAAGLTPQNTFLATGSVGAPESTLELEVSFASLAELEQFWSAIPAAAHREWGQRMQQHIVHGSPTWHVYRALPAFPAADDGLEASRPSPGAATSAPLAASFQALGGSGLLAAASEEEVGRYGAAAAEGSAAPPATQRQTASGLSVVSGEAEAQTMLDWKGDVMTINPGDKLPFRLL